VENSPAVQSIIDAYVAESANTATAYGGGSSQIHGSASSGVENQYDKIYQLNAEANMILRQREKLERAYTKALEDSGKTVKELTAITYNQLKKLEEEADK
jgi:hypothetical protein